MAENVDTGRLYEARKRVASAMQVGKNGVARSATGSALYAAKRPDIVAQKTRMGDWEGDTVIGKNHKGGLVTLAERVSRYVLAGHIRSKHAAGVTAVTTRLLSPHKEECHTITFDNGKEFAVTRNSWWCRSERRISTSPIPTVPGA